MDLLTAVWLGAAGGVLVEAIAMFAYLTAWQEARHRERVGSGSELPALSAFVDVPADTAVAITRLVLGAAAGLIFHGQLSGVAAAIAVGASGPAVLQQLGSLRTVRETIRYGDASGAGSLAGSPGEETHISAMAHMAVMPVDSEEPGTRI